MVCKAEEWLLKGVVEDPTRPNRGTLVDQIHLRYRGWTQQQLETEWSKTRTGVGLAWCSEFVWVVADDVAQIMGIPNCLPGWSKALGRALDTLTLSRAILPTITKTQMASGAEVEAGMIFYRSSSPTKQSSSSTGHMGIVTRVTPTGIETIEGNQADSDRVARYSYTLAQIQSYPVFEFIDIGECAKSLDRPDALLATPTSDCFALYRGVRTVQGGISTSTEGLHVETVSTPPLGAPPASSNSCDPLTWLGTDYPKQPEATKQQRCTSVQFIDLNPDTLLQYTDLRAKDSSGRRFIAADITGATYGLGSGETTNSWFAQRNGSAINRMHAQRTRANQETQWAVMRGKASKRLYYLFREGTDPWRSQWACNTIANGYGKDAEPILIRIQRVEGNSFRERMADVLAGEIPLWVGTSDNELRVTVRRNGQGVILRGPGGVAPAGGEIEMDGVRASFTTLQDLLALFDTGALARVSETMPVVVVWNEDPRPLIAQLSDLIQVVQTGLSIAIPVAGLVASTAAGSAVGSVLKTLTDAQSYVGKLYSALQTTANGSPFEIACDLGGVILPQEYGQYLPVVKSGYRAIREQSIARGLQTLQLFGSTTAGQEAITWAQGVRDDLYRDIGPLLKTITVPVEQARKTIATLQVGHLVSKVAEYSSLDIGVVRSVLASGIASKDLPTHGPLMTMVQSLAAGQMPSTVPNLMGAVQLLTSFESTKSFLRNLPQTKGLEFLGQLSILAGGYSSPCGMWKELAFNAFSRYVEENPSQKTFVTPPFLSIEESECFAYRLRGDHPDREYFFGDSTTTTTGTPPKLIIGGGSSTVTSSPTTVRTDFNTVVTTTPPQSSSGTSITGGSTTVVSTPTIRPGDFSTITLQPSGGTITPGSSIITAPSVPNAPTVTGGSTSITRNDWNPIVPLVQCPPGSESIDGICVPIAPIVQQPVVQQPVVQQPVVQTPVVVQQRCPDGYTLINGVCVPPTPVIQQQQCPQGYSLINGQCIPPTPQIVQQQCPPGYSWDGTACVSPPPPVKQQQCPQGYTWDGTACVPPQPPVRQPQCPDGYSYQNGECVPPTPAIRPPTCPEGYRLNAQGECEAPPPVVKTPPPNDWNPQQTPPQPFYSPFGPLIPVLNLTPSGGCGCGCG